MAEQVEDPHIAVAQGRARPAALQQMGGEQAVGRPRGPTRLPPAGRTPSPPAPSLGQAGVVVVAQAQLMSASLGSTAPPLWQLSKITSSRPALTSRSSAVIWSPRIAVPARSSAGVVGQDVLLGVAAGRVVPVAGEVDDGRVVRANPLGQRAQGLADAVPVAWRPPGG